MVWIVGIKTKFVTRKNMSNGIVAPPVADFLIVISFRFEKRTK
jgi:hypothetical protein